MADVKQSKDLLPKRCGERVRRARIHPEAAIVPLPSKTTFEVGKEGIEAMALHPWGLAVVFKGEVHVLPSASVTSTTLAAEE